MGLEGHLAFAEALRLVFGFMFLLLAGVWFYQRQWHVGSLCIVVAGQAFELYAERKRLTSVVRILRGAS